MSSEKKLEVEIRQVYGKETIYPVNEQAKLVCLLLKQASLTRQDIGILKKLGHTIEVVQTTPRQL